MLLMKNIKNTNILICKTEYINDRLNLIIDENICTK
jgi:hypothetical protein